MKTEDIKRWFDRYGSSVILPLIALAILAGGIYLYSTQTKEEINQEKEINNIPSVELKTNWEMAKEACHEVGKEIIEFEGRMNATDDKFRVVCGR